ncbi:MAG: hypothetical protein QG629_597 [Patescibacteria group bacterium]|nr:hypothetical protein [Candidatus Saccharibacteria bacterium]MDQ5963515.1 hypothetical protein [Patescibacteria group bacterium]
MNQINNQQNFVFETLSHGVEGGSFAVPLYLDRETGLNNPHTQALLRFAEVIIGDSIKVDASIPEAAQTVLDLAEKTEPGRGFNLSDGPVGTRLILETETVTFREVGGPNKYMPTNIVKAMLRELIALHSSASS